MDHTPLDLGQLSTAAQRALGPGPGRVMASRGMMPLPPADQVAVLYMLAIDGDAVVAATARATAAGLPDKLLAGTLADPKLDRRILDLFAALGGNRPAVFEAVAMNPSTADDTIAVLAGRGGAREIDLIAGNEQRLLRHPPIIAAMYLNKHARMSTVDRAVELAVRNNVRVPGLAAWDEIARALQATPSTDKATDDEVFAKAAEQIADDAALVGDPEAAADLVEAEEASGSDPAQHVPQWSELGMPAKVRLATIGNAVQRGMALRDPSRSVAMAAVKSPKLSEFEIARIAASQVVSEDVIRYVASSREFTKSYGVRKSLCRNPKTPLAESSRMLVTLRERDLTTISRSKGVPSALVANARKLLMQRRGSTGAGKK